MRAADGLERGSDLPSQMYTSATEPRVGRKARRVVGSCSQAVEEEMMRVVMVGSSAHFL